MVDLSHRSTKSTTPLKKALSRARKPATRAQWGPERWWGSTRESFFLVVGAFPRLQLRRKPDSGPESGMEHSRGLELYSLGMRAKRAEARKKALATNTGFWNDPSEGLLCCFQRYISRKTCAQAIPHPKLRKNTEKDLFTVFLPSLFPENLVSGRFFTILGEV